MVYDAVTGFPKHTVRGTYYHLFRHHGHNIVVSRIIPGPSVRTPDNLETALDQSYRKREDTSISLYPCGFFGWSVCQDTTYTFNAEKTNSATWDALHDRQGVSPVMLHVVKNGISVSSESGPYSVSIDGHTVYIHEYVVDKRMDGGYVTLSAKQ